MAETMQHILTMMEWMGTSPRPEHINSEVGTLADDRLTAAPLFTFLRRDLPLDPAPGMSIQDAARFAQIDDPDIIAPLYARPHPCGSAQGSGRAAVP